MYHDILFFSVFLCFFRISYLSVFLSFNTHYFHWNFKRWDVCHWEERSTYQCSSRVNIMSNDMKRYVVKQREKRRRYCSHHSSLSESIQIEVWKKQRLKKKRKEIFDIVLILSNIEVRLKNRKNICDLFYATNCWLQY